MNNTKNKSIKRAENRFVISFIIMIMGFINWLTLSIIIYVKEYEMTWILLLWVSQMLLVMFGFASCTLLNNKIKRYKK